MARRSILSATERDSLFALPESQDDLILHYSFTESDLSTIRQRSGDANRIGFAVQLCLLRYPGYALAGDMPVPKPAIQWGAAKCEATPTPGSSTAPAMKRDVNGRTARALRSLLRCTILQ